MERILRTWWNFPVPGMGEIELMGPQSAPVSEYQMQGTVEYLKTTAEPRSEGLWTYYMIELGKVNGVTTDVHVTLDSAGHVWNVIAFERYGNELEFAAAAWQTVLEADAINHPGADQ